MRDRGVVDECLGVENESVAIDAGRIGGEHLDADTGQGAALGEFKFSMMLLPKFPFAGVRGQKASVSCRGLSFLAA